MTRRWPRAGHAIYPWPMPTAPVDLSVVVPMYNEEAVLPLLVERLRPAADGWGVSYEVLCVDDGSTDATPVLLQRLRREWPQVRVVRLRANAGHQAAISAGLARARGQWVVTLDADLQDPPEVIGEMLAVARGQGVDVVYGVRTDRSTDTAFKRVTARAFYRSIRAMSDVDARVDAGDFRMMSRATVDAVNALPEHGRVLRLVVPALGFPSASVNYTRAARAAGDSKYPLGKMIRLSVDGITGFSTAPLRFATWIGLVGGLAAIGVLHLRARGAAARQHPPRLDVDGRHRRGGGGGAAARARHPRGVRGPHLRRPAGATVVLRRARLARRGARARAATVRPGSDRRPRRPTWSSSARAGPSGRGRAASGSRCRSRRRSRTRRRR